MSKPHDLILRRFYFYTFIPLIFFLVILTLFNTQIITIMYFILGYVWCMAIIVPGLREKASHMKYRYSFVRMAFVFNDFFISLLPKRIPEYLGRSIMPLIFTFLMYLISSSGFFPVAVFGSIFLELAVYLGKSYYKSKSFFEISSINE